MSIPGYIMRRAREIYEVDPDLLAAQIELALGYSWTIYEKLRESPPA